MVIRPENSESISRWYELSNDYELGIKEFEMPKFSVSEYEDEAGKFENHPKIGFLIKNNTDEDVDDCWAKLTSVRFIFPETKSSPSETLSNELINNINSDHLNLSWSGSQEKEFYTLKGNGGEGVIRLAETQHNGSLDFVFFGKTNENNASGKYRIKIDVHIGEIVETIEKVIESGSKIQFFREIHGMKEGGKETDEGVQVINKNVIKPYLIFVKGSEGK